MAPHSTFGVILFVSYLVVLAAIGVICARCQKNVEQFWVAGRRFGLVVMVIALMASLMHGGSILSGIAFAARFGGVSMLAFLSFALGSLVVMVFFAKKLRESRGFTLPDYMGDRFESNFLRGFSAVVIAISSILYLVAQIRVMGFVLSDLLGIEFIPSLALGTGIFVFYVSMGGLLAVVWTDIAQFLFMWLGLAVLMPAVGRAVGGFSEVMLRADAVSPGWTSVQGTEWSFGYLVGWYLLWLVAYATRIEMITKVFAARDTRIARFAFPITILLVIVFLTYGNLYLGAAARVHVWDQITVADEAFSALVLSVASPLVAALALTGVAAAAQSTTSSLLLMSGASIAHDLLRKCFYEPRKIVKSEHFYLFVARLSIILVGLISFVAAIQTPALILQIVSYAVAIVGTTFFFPLLLGMHWKAVTAQGATASAVGGFSLTVFWTALQIGGVPWSLGVHPFIPGIVASFVLITMVSKFRTDNHARVPRNMTRL